MKNIVLFDRHDTMRSLLPLTFTRPAAALRCGILRISEKWERRMGAEVSYLTEPRLAALYPAAVTADSLFIASNVLPTDSLVEQIEALAIGEALMDPEGRVVAFRGSKEDFDKATTGKEVEVTAITAPQHIFIHNGEEIVKDFELITRGRRSMAPDKSCTVIGDPALLFIEDGAKCLCATFNTTEGPIYIGRDAEVMEGCSLRGPVALCDHSVFKMGAKVYPETTIGPWCKIGGEISNIVMTGYSNKAHDGYLGNAVIGEWCNLGAGCVSSNLKNDYSLIRLWNYATCRFEHTGMQFCGLIMGDHSKAGIQTMFNTATVVGVGCNIHGAGFPRTFIPSFSFGGAAGFDRLRYNKFIETARAVMARRHVELTPDYQHLLATLYELDDYGNEK